MAVGRACVVCGRISEAARCPEHRREPWTGRTRRTRLSGWAQQRRAAQVIAHHAGICHVCGEGGATQADHVVPIAEGGADDFWNMRPIHADCHKAKTGAEAQRGRARVR